MLKTVAVVGSGTAGPVNRAGRSDCPAQHKVDYTDCVQAMRTVFSFKENIQNRLSLTESFYHNST